MFWRFPTCLSIASAFTLAATTCVAAHAEVRLPHVLSDHMVLQRDAPIHVWGWAEPGETVRVSLDGDKAQATTDRLGQWSVFLKRHAAGGPYSMHVQGNGAPITVNDLMMGELWIASGQSNMEMPLAGFGGAPLKDSEKEIAAANHPELRLLVAPKVGADFPQSDIAVSWSRCTPETAKQFSAAAYFFGREISAKEHVAIGLIDTSWGGTPAEAWASFDAFGADPGLAPVWTQWSRFTSEQTDMPARIAAEKREDEQRLQTGQPKVWHYHPEAQSYRPASLYNGMIAPFTPLSIRGAIWYQGETNSRLDRSILYHRLFQDMIQDWRAHFQQGNFPFLFVQISSFRSTPQEAWGVLRDAQRRTLELTNTAMAVTLDVGVADNVHPGDKQTVGHRLALAARATVYGEATLPYTGPLFARADVEGDAMRVSFQDRAAKLTCAGAGCTGFEIAGEDHKFVAADARIDGATVMVRSGSVAQPQYVRYAWPNAPVANLQDAAGLPASTFTSEAEISEAGPRATALTHD